MGVHIGSRGSIICCADLDGQGAKQYKSQDQRKPALEILQTKIPRFRHFTLTKQDDTSRFYAILQKITMQCYYTTLEF